jgi:hypothetical protein
MEATLIRQTRDELILKDGPWSSHNIHLGHGLYTIPEQDPTKQPHSLRRVLRTVQDLLGRPLASSRVLDLACLEGLYGLEFALHGASVVGIEGREISLRKAQLSKDALGLSNIEFHLDDVRNLTAGKYGTFDVVLCLGILYHLDAPDVFRFVESIASVCRRLALFHTHVARGPRVSKEWQGRRYHGREVLEHLPSEDRAMRARAVWGSLDNEKSFWLTRPSLLNLLRAAGFSTVCECRIPYLASQPGDHVTFVCIKGEPCDVRAFPPINAIAEDPWPERRRETVNVGQTWYYRTARWLGQWGPVRWIMLRLVELPGVTRLLGLEWHSRER